MKRVLLVSIGFSPNIGGIETHFEDLINALYKRNWAVTVLTYLPLTTKVKAKYFEKRSQTKTVIYRVPVVRGLFYKLVHMPIMVFIYLIPGLFIFLPILLLIKGRKYEVIHSHGLIAGFVCVFWGKVFGKKVITTTHSMYSFKKNGLYTKLAKWIFGRSDVVLTLSNQSKKEIENLGIAKDKINVFTYWIDLDNFKAVKNKDNLKAKLKLKSKFVVLFVGRLIKEKGVLTLLGSAKEWNDNIGLYIAGTGQLDDEVKNYARKYKNLNYLGGLTQKELVNYYQAADLLIVPSEHEEGFGRVILEALACGTPVIGSKRGAIGEAMDRSVGELIDVSEKNIKIGVEKAYKNHKDWEMKAIGCRKFAEEKYSEKNVEQIIKTYSK